MCNSLRFGLLVGTLLLLILTGCSDPDEDEVIIGTGLILEGTVTENRQFAQNKVQIKAASGEVSNAIIDDVGRYRAPSVKGAPPYLMRVDLGNDEYRYGIAFEQGRSNIHSYTDVIIRNWFESKNGNLDFEFEQPVFATELPTELQFRTNADTLLDLAKLVLESYQLSGDQLLSGDYDSNPAAAGINQYLRSNPMLIQDDTISLVITDPKNQTQSTTRSSFSVFELATEPDTQSPDVPNSVRALPSAINEIVIVWEPSSDNRGVIGYEVFRDGSLITTTPYPAYFDNDPLLLPNRIYSYQIVAIDSSNNTSALSLPATSSTLGEIDETPPPAPVQLSVTPSLGRMDLIWGQTMIGDVVSFDVYRGRESDTPEFLKSVTSTIMTDVSVSSGVQYCYQIVAVDASGNESDRSSEVCRTAEGQEVRSLNTEVSSSVPPLAGLTIPDTESMACSLVWENYVISEPVVIEAGCYNVDKDIEIENGGNLSLEPGVVLKFGTGTRLIAKSGGSFTSVGTQSNPVVLTAQDPTPGYWRGIEFADSNSSRNKLVNSVLEYGGGGSDRATVLMRSSLDTNSRLEIAGSLVRRCLGAGVAARSERDLLNLLDGSVITECGYPLDLHILGLDGITQRNQFIGNEEDLIDLRNALVSSDFQLMDLGVPYVVNDLTVQNVRLDVLEGVEIKFRVDGELEVNGSLFVEGRPDKRVVFSGTTEQRGHWVGMYVRGDLSLRFTDVVNAGAGFVSTSASIVFPNQQDPYFQDVNISESASYALNFFSQLAEERNLGGIRMTNNARTIRMPFASVGQLDTSLEFENNSSPEIVLFRTSVNKIGLDIYDLGVPYYLSDYIDWNAGFIRIHSGVELLFADGIYLNIAGSAFLDIGGTDQAPVFLSHASGYPGAWIGLQFDTQSSNNRIDHATISFAGGQVNKPSSTIEILCNQNVDVRLSNTTIENSDGWGIFSFGSVVCGPQIGENVQFFQNRLGDIGTDF